MLEYLGLVALLSFYAFAFWLGWVLGGSLTKKLINKFSMNKDAE